MTHFPTTNLFNTKRFSDFMKQPLLSPQTSKSITLYCRQSAHTKTLKVRLNLCHADYELSTSDKSIISRAGYIHSKKSKIDLLPENQKILKEALIHSTQSFSYRDFPNDLPMEELHHKDWESKENLETFIQNNPDFFLTPYLQYRLYFFVQMMDKNAIEILKKAINLGHLQAKVDLGELYLYRGNNTQQDLKPARDIFQEAANDGIYAAFFYLGILSFQEKDVTLQEQGREYLLKAADAGIEAAQSEVAQGYIFGKYRFPINQKLGRKYAKKAVKNQNSVAMNLVGEGRLFGLYGFKKNIHRGQDLLICAAENGNSRSQLLVAEGMLFKKFGFGLEIEKGKKFIKLAARAGETRAQSIAGEGYVFGKFGFKVKPKVGEEFLKKASDNGDIDAKFLLGHQYVMYHHMYDRNQLGLGLQYLHEASQHGYVHAKTLIGEALVTNSGQFASNLNRSAYIYIHDYHFHNIPGEKTILVQAPTLMSKSIPIIDLPNLRTDNHNKWNEKNPLYVSMMNFVANHPDHFFTPHLMVRLAIRQAMAEVQKKYYIEKSAQKGNFNAKLLQAVGYIKGESGFTKSPKEGLALLLALAKDVYIPAKTTFAELFLTSENQVHRNLAQNALSEAAAAGDNQAKAIWGEGLLFEKYGFSRNEELGREYLREAAQNINQLKAKVIVGRGFLYGIYGFAQNHESGKVYLDTAYAGGSIQAQAYIGQALIEGTGYARNVTTGLKFLEEANKKDNKTAKEALNKFYQEQTQLFVKPQMSIVLSTQNPKQPAPVSVDDNQDSSQIIHKKPNYIYLQNQQKKMNDARTKGAESLLAFSRRVQKNDAPLDNLKRQQQGGAESHAKRTKNNTH